MLPHAEIVPECVNHELTVAQLEIAEISGGANGPPHPGVVSNTLWLMTPYRIGLTSRYLQQSPADGWHRWKPMGAMSS